jgi:MFS family permease
MKNNAEKFGPIYLEKDITRGNVLAYFFAAFVSIGLYTYFVALTPFIFRVNLDIPLAEQGRLSGELQFWQEIVIMFSVGAFGALSDRIGRRAVYMIGFTLMGIGYALYPLADSFGSLMAYRLILSCGIAATSAMLATLIADYAMERSHGVFLGCASMLNGFGSVLFFMVLTKMPSWYQQSGMQEIEAGRSAYFTIAALAFISAAVMWGLKGGRPTYVTEKLPVLKLIKQGLAAAKAPRIALSYGASFASRADMLIINLFLSLWANQSFQAQGVIATEAAGKSGALVGMAQGTALLFAIAFAIFSDRIERMNSMIIAFLIATVSYIWIGITPDVTAKSAIPILMILGGGQMLAFLASQMLLAGEAPKNIRGSVFGLQGFFGALGILAMSSLGGYFFDSIGPGMPFVLMGLTNGIILLWSIWVKYQEVAERRYQVKNI